MITVSLKLFNPYIPAHDVGKVQSPERVENSLSKGKRDHHLRTHGVIYFGMQCFLSSVDSAGNGVAVDRSVFNIILMRCRSKRVRDCHPEPKKTRTLILFLFI